MRPTWDVLGMGAVAVDDLVYLDGFPAPDSKMPIVGEQRAGGGLAGTALVAAARLGARAAYFGVLGDDDQSAFTVAELAREGVDCAPVRRHPDARPIHSVILVNRKTGERTILFNRNRVMPPAPDDITDALVGACRVLFVDSTVAAAALRATERARALGVQVVADLEHPGAPGVPELAARVHHLIVGVTFARQVTGESEPAAMVRALARPEHAACVVTAGERGCWYMTGGSGDVVHQPACRVPVVDTTGCGDVFHGAYAAAVARGDGVTQAVAVATAAAALKAMKPGGRQGIPDWPALANFMQEQNCGNA